jgi:hypothetical protein
MVKNILVILLLALFLQVKSAGLLGTREIKGQMKNGNINSINAPVARILRTDWMIIC